MEAEGAPRGQPGLASVVGPPMMIQAWSQEERGEEKRLPLALPTSVSLVILPSSVALVAKPVLHGSHHGRPSAYVQQSKPMQVGLPTPVEVPVSVALPMLVALPMPMPVGMEAALAESVARVALAPVPAEPDVFAMAGARARRGRARASGLAVIAPVPSCRAHASATS